eukprot:14725418-Ditylum_brightwellii.AAC.1
MRFHLLISSIALPFFASDVFAAANKDHAEALIKWLKKENGVFNSKTSFRLADPNKNNSVYGYFADGNLAKDELLFEIPRSMVLSGEPSGINMECDIARNLAKELKLGNSSKYAPWVEYLLDTQPSGQIPST